MREATDQNRANLAAVAGERQSEAERIERALATPGERILEGFRPGAEARWTRTHLAEPEARTDGEMEGRRLIAIGAARA
jgi:hypothetical protein